MAVAQTMVSLYASYHLMSGIKWCAPLRLVFSVCLLHNCFVRAELPGKKTVSVIGCVAHSFWCFSLVTFPVYLVMECYSFLLQAKIVCLIACTRKGQLTFIHWQLIKCCSMVVPPQFCTFLHHYGSTASCPECCPVWMIRTQVSVRSGCLYC